jgi:hypothetical protein
VIDSPPPTKSISTSFKLRIVYLTLDAGIGDRPVSAMPATGLQAVGGIFEYLQQRNLSPQ